MPHDLAAIKGKVAVFVGGGGLSKEPHYRAARDWGLKTIIVRSPADRLSVSSADLVLTFDSLDNHSCDDVNASQIVELLAEHRIAPDCVLTIWEDCGPVAARVARLLGLHGIDPDSAVAAKSKVLTQARLRASRLAEVASLAIESFPLNSTDDLDAAIKAIGLPAIMKLEHGSSAAGVCVVNSPPEAFAHWSLIKNSLKRESDCPGVGLGFSTNVLLSELLVGSEHDVDLVLWEGKAVAGFVTDNGPTRFPRCAEASAIMPSTMESAAQDDLVLAAVKACAGIGIHSGVVNIEMIKTIGGVKVIDVNARMGGFYIRDWICRLWDYDLLFAVLCCALGLRPPPSGAASGWIAGAMVLPSTHGAWMSEVSNRTRLFHSPPSSCEIVNIFDEHVQPMDGVDEPYGNLAVWSATPDGAIKSLKDVWARWGLLDCDTNFASILPPVFHKVPD
jgi:carnosine synthase